MKQGSCRRQEPDIGRMRQIHSFNSPVRVAVSGCLKFMDKSNHGQQSTHTLSQKVSNQPHSLLKSVISKTRILVP